jgi:hypothetical protein
MGGGKNGVMDASPQPASPAGNGETASKERTTAATPTTPLEKIPAETLTKPVEKTPPAQPPEAERLLNPFPSLADIKEALSRITGATRPPETVPPDSNSPKKSAAEQQH